MGNKHKANSRLPSVDAESRRPGLAFQQDTPTPGKLEGKENIRFIFYFPDMINPVNRVRGIKEHLAIKKLPVMFEHNKYQYPLLQLELHMLNLLIFGSGTEYLIL